MNRLILSLLLLGAAPAAAQQSPSCAGNARPRPDLGISIACENCTVGDYDRPASWSFATDPRVAAVSRGGAAAGVLEPGDEIVRVNGFAITTAQGATAFASPAIGRTMVLTVRRGGSLRAVNVTPTATCPEAIRSNAVVSGRASEAPRAASAVVPATGWLGIAFDCTDCSIHRQSPGVNQWQFSAPPRIYSVETNSPAYRAGLRRGDLVTQVDGIEITQAEAGRRLGSIRPGQTLRIGYRREGSNSSVAVRAATSPLPRVAVAGTRPDAERELRELIVQQQRIEQRAQTLADARERVVSQELYQRLRTHADESAKRLVELQRKLGGEENESRRRELEAELRALRESGTRHQQMLLNELVVKQAEETRRLQELQRELARGASRVPLVASTRAPSGQASVTSAGAGSAALRYSGSVGSAAVEVRGPLPVVVDRSGDTVTISIGATTVRITPEKR